MMTQETHVKSQLRRWILEHAKVSPRKALDDETLILEERILSSLDIAEFVLYIESLRGTEIDLDSLEPEAFASINALYATFFAGT